MKKIVSFLLMGIFLQQVSLHASNSSQTSCCEKFIMGVNIWAARNFLGMTNQDVFSAAIEESVGKFNNRKPLNYCLQNKIGSMNGIDSQGHSPQDVARICKRSVMFRDGSDIESLSPTSVADRKNLKFKQS